MAPIQKKSTLRPLFTLVVDETAIVQHKLRIPKKCVMLFGEELGEMGTLTVPHGNGNRAWKVRIVKNGKNKKKKCHNNNNIWFKDGMEEFINYYSIHLHSILQFTYQGNSMFSVRICDALGSEIDYPFDEEDEDEDEEDDDDDDDDDDDEDGDDDDDYVCKSYKRKSFNSQKQSGKRTSVASKDHNSKQSSQGFWCHVKQEQVDDDDNDNDEHEMVVPRSFDYHKGRRLVMSKGAKAAQAAAYASKSKLHNPSFMGIVNQHNIRMAVPAEFVRRHMKFCVDKSVEVELQPQAKNDEKMKWVVSCCPMKKCGTLMKRLGKGWSSFSSNQNLKSGDVCVFEMIPNLNANGDLVFRVWIYRAANYE
ncbi:B3 domain-containing transcription factor VRN1 [Cannabis sativa]|uniref:B3 domain-containing transcription factor VRN1 n=1 Tax=Cannabis sativa TaxID=3483 RepID=UPI0029CA4599|nr:B3 domain-containing transcription factor VRN1 [Cannabis sativa]XP_060972041.1 B3 domain-containing transcription factor VRN1 [Cannabis sativa]